MTVETKLSRGGIAKLAGLSHCIALSSFDIVLSLMKVMLGDRKPCNS
jgi:hypothetical protein